MTNQSSSSIVLNKKLFTITAVMSFNNKLLKCSRYRVRRFLIYKDCQEKNALGAQMITTTELQNINMG